MLEMSKPSHHHMQAPWTGSKAPLMVVALTLLQLQALGPTETMVLNLWFPSCRVQLGPLVVFQLHKVANSN